MSPPHPPWPDIRPQNLGTAQAMIKVARSQLGYREGPDNATAYGLIYGLNNQPWCYIFQSVIARVAGCGKVIPRGAYTPAGADWFRRRGQWHATPHKGDLHFVFHASLGRVGHVELVERVFPDGSFHVIGGNTSSTGSRQGDGVYRLKRSRVTPGSGFGRPAYKAYTP